MGIEKITKGNYIVLCNLIAVGISFMKRGKIFFSYSSLHFFMSCKDFIHYSAGALVHKLNNIIEIKC